jgi:prophage maintenance system killer protein
LDLADSALHAPAAGFGDAEFYTDFVGKAAVLVVHLAKNHPLPDGNKTRRLGHATRLHRDQRLDLDHATNRR